MSDYLRSVVRTVVPALWAALVAWAIAQGLPGSALLPVEVPAAVVDAILTGAVPVVLTVVYAAIRAAESVLPVPLVRLFLGSALAPGYSSTDVDASDGTVTIGGVTYSAGPAPAVTRAAVEAGVRSALDAATVTVDATGIAGIVRRQERDARRAAGGFPPGSTTD